MGGALVILKQSSVNIKATLDSLSENVLNSSSISIDVSISYQTEFDKTNRESENAMIQQ